VQAAEVTGTAHVIRHTVRTWLAEAGVPDAEADVFMGHKAEGSATGKRYIHRRPGFLKSVAEGIELLFAALSDLVARPFASHERVDQPHPDDAICALLRANSLIRPYGAVQPIEYGAGNETRTRDPDLGKVVLYQLSYSRISSKQGRNCRSKHHEVKADRGGRSQ
jgi:hypothetical protein